MLDFSYFFISLCDVWIDINIHIGHFSIILEFKTGAWLFATLNNLSVCLVLRERDPWHSVRHMFPRPHK